MVLKFENNRTNATSWGGHHMCWESWVSYFIFTEVQVCLHSTLRSFFGVARQRNLCITRHLNFTPCHLILFPRVNLKTKKSIRHTERASVCVTHVWGQMQRSNIKIAVLKVVQHCPRRWPWGTWAGVKLAKLNSQRRDI